MYVSRAHPDFWVPPQPHQNYHPAPPKPTPHASSHSSSSQAKSSGMANKPYDPWANPSQVSQHGDTVHTSKPAQTSSSSSQPKNDSMGKKPYDPWANAQQVSAHGDTVHISYRAPSSPPSPAQQHYGIGKKAYDPWASTNQTVPHNTSSQQSTPQTRPLTPQEQRVKALIKIQQEKERDLAPRSGAEIRKDTLSYNEWYWVTHQAPNDTFNHSLGNKIGEILGVGSIKNDIKTIGSDAPLGQKLKAGVDIAFQVGTDALEPEGKVAVVAVKTLKGPAGNVIKDVVKDVVKDVEHGKGAEAVSKGVTKGTEKVEKQFTTAIDDKLTEIKTQDLPSWLKGTFTDGQYRTGVTNEEVTLYRTFGGKADAGGAFATTEPAENRIQAKIDTAQLPEWGGSRMYQAKIVVPKGTVLNIGKVEQQTVGSTGTVLKGGADQVLLPPNWPLSWIKSIDVLPSK